MICKLKLLTSREIILKSDIVSHQFNVKSKFDLSNGEERTFWTTLE